MTDDLRINKDTLRAEAKRARGLLSLDVQEHERLCTLFFENIAADKNSIVAAYWSKGREFDTHILIDACLERGITVALPVIESETRILKFVCFDNNVELVRGKFDVCHPIIDEQTNWLEPDILIVPLLAFDRKGCRLGYGGGYYDATLAHYKEKKEILAVGLGYAEQACLFNLPAEEHDINMDWIITQQGATRF